MSKLKIMSMNFSPSFLLSKQSIPGENEKMMRIASSYLSEDGPFDIILLQGKDAIARGESLAKKDSYKIFSNSDIIDRLRFKTLAAAELLVSKSTIAIWIFSFFKAFLLGRYFPLSKGCILYLSKSFIVGEQEVISNNNNKIIKMFLFII